MTLMMWIMFGTQAASAVGLLLMAIFSRELVDDHGRLVDTGWHERRVAVPLRSGIAPR